MEEGNKIKLIYGLGNPGKKYKNTPHNFGRDLIEFYISEKKQDLGFAILGKYKNIYLCISNLYMNESGKALKEIIKKLKIPLKNTLIIHDEADLNFLYIKITFNKGASMHKGVESIYKECGTDVWRFRIGIQYLKYRVKAEKIILKKLPKNLLKKWEEAKIKFKFILEELNHKDIEKLNIPSVFFINNLSL